LAHTFPPWVRPFRKTSSYCLYHDSRPWLYISLHLGELCTRVITYSFDRRQELFHATEDWTTQLYDVRVLLGTAAICSKCYRTLRVQSNVVRRFRYGRIASFVSRGYLIVARTGHRVPSSSLPIFWRRCRIQWRARRVVTANRRPTTTTGTRIAATSMSSLEID